MTTTNQYLELAQQHAVQQGLPYTGALSPQDAFELLKQNPTARLVDVRTDAERAWVGFALTPHEQGVDIEWNQYPNGQPNRFFLDELKQHSKLDTPLLFLCRSGVRSHHAAVLATQAGFQICINILGGFEGDKDQYGHRGTVNGWKHAGLPWMQG